jgi:hypothetical protein
MRKVFGFALILIFAFLFGSSCSNKDVTPAACRLKKITSTLGNSTVTSTFDYNSDNKLVQMTVSYSGSTVSTKSVKYSYTAGEISGVAGSNVTETWTVKDKKVISTSAVEDNGTKRTVDIDYTSDGRLSGWKVTMVSFDLEYHLTPTYDANGNIIKDESESTQTYNGSLEEGHGSNTYSGFDSKNNPFKLLGEAQGLLNYFPGFEIVYNPKGYCKNNPGKVTVESSGTFGSSTTVYEYTYEYNNINNYPSKMIVKSGASYNTATTTFEYINCD